MRILIACEYTGIVRDAFALKGHDVMSCDLLPCERGGNHYQGNVLDVLYEQWDMVIGHPPCTFICNGQIHLLKTNAQRQLKSKLAIEFAQKLWQCGAPRICIENPKGLLSYSIGKPSQLVNPWFFGSPYDKDICLWLKNLPLLHQTHFVKGNKKVSNHVNSRMSTDEKSKIKSRFFPEVALAMAEKWG